MGKNRKSPFSKTKGRSSMPSMLAAMSISVILKLSKTPSDDVMDGSSLDEAFKLFESIYKQHPSSDQDELLKIPFFRG